MPLRPPKGFIDETDPRVAQIGHPAPPWLVNYADLMTELVCFFVILYALSAALSKNMQSAKQDVDKMMKSGQMSGSASIDKDGLKITIQEQGKSAFFGTGDAEPTPAIDADLSKLAPILKKLSADHEILVEGHTDDQPIHNLYFDSNWELSTARATSVTRLLIDKYHLPADHMGAVGYGATRPLVPNDNDADRAKNRRVVIFIKSAEFKPSPAAAKAAGGAAPGAPAAAPASDAPPPANPKGP
ncbi:MAG: flagellar motor protein MotB [Elusimicrobia bacterium]|nr:flagellar motor protein MotB [Elusimicrobiota bacterium]